MTHHGSSSNQRLQLRKAPVQKRSLQTFNWILEAAAELIEQQGFELTTTNEIAERAGVSVGSVYQYFPNKDTILLHLLERLSTELFAALGEIVEKNQELEDPALEPMVREMLEVMLTYHMKSPVLHQECWSNSSFTEEIGAFKTAQRERLRQMVQAFLEFHPQIHLPNPPLSAWMLIHMVTSLVHEYIHQFSAFTEGSFFEELNQMILLYLQSPRVSQTK